MNAPDGSGLTLIGDTARIRGATETSGILDISGFVGFNPGSILLTSNQGNRASLTVLVNPAATVIPEPSVVVLATYALFVCGCYRRNRVSVTPPGYDGPAARKRPCRTSAPRISTMLAVA